MFLRLTHFILEDRLSGLCTRLEAREINTFPFECSEERFGDGVIPTVALAAHTHCHAPFCQKGLVRGASVTLHPRSV
jgi:hypothetical protein